MRGHVLSPISQTDVRRLVLGGAISSYGDALQNAAQAWIVVQLTHSGRAVGLFAMVWLLPRTISSLVAGVLADRGARVRVIGGAVVIGTVFSAIFLAVAATGALSYAVVLLLALGLGLTAPFEIVGRNALLATLGPPEEIPAIVNLSFFVMYCAELLGLVTSGLLLSSVGPLGCIALNLITYLAYLALLARVRTPRVERAPQRLHHAFREGVRFVLGNRRAAVPLLIGSLLAITGFHFERSTLPLFAVEDLHASARQYGLLLAASPLGAVLTLGLLRTDAAALRARVIGSAFALAIALALLALVTRPAAAFPILVFLGSARGLHYNAIATFLQMRVPDAMRGRVFALYNVAGGLFGVGGLLMGWTAATVGARVSAHVAPFGAVGDVHGLRGALLLAAAASAAAALVARAAIERPAAPAPS